MAGLKINEHAKTILCKSIKLLILLISIASLICLFVFIHEEIKYSDYQKTKAKYVTYHDLLLTDPNAVHTVNTIPVTDFYIFNANNRLYKVPVEKRGIIERPIASVGKIEIQYNPDNPNEIKDITISTYAFNCIMAFIVIIPMLVAVYIILSALYATQHYK